MNEPHPKIHDAYKIKHVIQCSNLGRNFGRLLWGFRREGGGVIEGGWILTFFQICMNKFCAHFYKERVSKNSIMGMI
jgi:hypothetical protein